MTCEQHYLIFGSLYTACVPTFLYAPITGVICGTCGQTSRLEDHRGHACDKNQSPTRRRFDGVVGDARKRLEAEDVSPTYEALRRVYA